MINIVLGTKKKTVPKCKETIKLTLSDTLSIVHKECLLNVMKILERILARLILNVPYDQSKFRLLDSMTM